METAVKRTRQTYVSLLLVAISVSGRSSVAGQNYTHPIQAILSELCPYSAVCNKTSAPKPGLESKMSCCTPCSCDTDCNTRGDCCSDLSSGRYSIKPKGVCKSPTVKKGTDYPDSPEHAFSYYMIDTCIPQYTDLETRKKCTDPKIDFISDVRHVTPVSDGKALYANRHCARCNNVIKFATWTPVLFNILGNIHHHDVNTMPQVYVLLFRPSDSEQARKLRCYEPSVSINTCNVTGQQDFRDDRLTKACEDSTFYYTAWRYDRKTVYKNPFCLICNRRDGRETEHDCVNEDPVTMAWHRRHIRPVYQMVISTRAPKVDPNAWHHVGRCLHNEIYDGYLDKCRPLHCPVFSAPVQGQCVSGNFKTTQFPMTSQFKLSSNITVSWDNLDRKTSTQISRALQERISLSERGCGACMSAVFVKTLDDLHLFVRVTHKATLKCSVQTVLNAYRTIAKSPIQFTIRIHNQLVAMTSQLEFDSAPIDMNELRRITVTYWLVDIDSEECPSQYVIEDKFCPYLEVSTSDFNVLKARSDLSINFNEFRSLSIKNYTMFFYRICVEDYMTNEGNNGGNPLLSRTGLWATWLFSFSNMAAYIFTR